MICAVASRFFWPKKSTEMNSWDAHIFSWKEHILLDSCYYFCHLFFRWSCLFISTQSWHCIMDTQTVELKMKRKKNKTQSFPRLRFESTVFNLYLTSSRFDGFIAYFWSFKELKSLLAEEWYWVYILYLLPNQVKYILYVKVFIIFFFILLFNWYLKYAFTFSFFLNVHLTLHFEIFHLHLLSFFIELLLLEVKDLPLLCKFTWRCQVKYCNSVATENRFYSYFCLKNMSERGCC